MVDAAMKCTGCKHLDLRNNECLELVPQTQCSRCNGLYAIRDIRCPSCLLASASVVSMLDVVDGECVASVHCPLTEDDRQRLIARQNTPVVVPVVQQELF